MVLITGAAGHLGTALVRELAERGEKMRAFVLPQGHFLVDFLPPYPYNHVPLIRITPPSG